MSNPFDKMTELQKKKLFDLLGVHIFKFKKNQEILPTIKNENIFGIILSGSAEISFMEYNRK